MKINKSLTALAVTTLLGWTAQSQAAIVTWDAPTAISADSDVSTIGTGVLAFDYGITPSQTVNTVSFSDSTTQSGVTVSVLGQSIFSGAALGLPALPGTVTSSYANILDGAGFMLGAAPLSITLSGLTTGQDYQVQFWVADYRSYPNNRTETITAGNTSGALAYLNGGSGSYVIGNFTADGTGSRTSLCSGMNPPRSTPSSFAPSPRSPSPAPKLPLDSVSAPSFSRSCAAVIGLHKTKI